MRTSRTKTSIRASTSARSLSIRLSRWRRITIMKLDLLLLGPRRLTKSTRWVATAAFVVGGLLLVWSAYIHVRLWKSDGYRHIPTIGTLFILQSSAGMVIGVAVVAVRRVWVAVLGAGFALSTMAGFLLTVEVGLFGFQDTWSAPFAQQAFFIEVAATVVLVVAGALCLMRPADTGSNDSFRSSFPLRA
jgi:hypothetical protein